MIYSAVMKMALLHYWLTNRRGGENVFHAICDMFPDGDIFTHAYNAKVMDDYQMAGIGGKIAMRTFRNHLRTEDLKSAECVDLFIANSQFVADRIKRIYGREAKVVHPMVDYDFFAATADASAATTAEGDYYLLAGQLVAYKRPDLAVAACLKKRRRLKIVGTGGEIDRLRAMAQGSPLVEFLGRVSRADLRRAYAHAKALLFPGIEDFGIVPLEAQAAGTPVIAFGVGGAKETVLENQTGLFFHEQRADALCAALETFESRTWNPALARANAARFTPDVFRREFGKALR